MARKYDVKGTQDFLIWAVVLFGLGIWAIRDGWYPSQAKLEKYPQRVPLSFEVSGIVEEVSAGVNQEVQTGTVLARLNDAAAQRNVDEADAALAAAAGGDRETLIRLRRQLEAAQEIREQHTLRSPESGLVIEVHIAPRAEVTPEDEAVILDPRHHFYPFNKSLAFISVLGAVVCLVVHFKVR